jgi:tetratricopeptide (TPR) repeat protein
MLLSLLYGFQAGRTALGDIAFERAFASALDAPTEQSITATEDALRYDRGNVQDLVFLGDLYRYQASQQEDIEKRVSLGQKALDAYRRAFLANSIDDYIPARQALTYDVMRRYTEAFLNYKQVVGEEPYNGEFWYWLGNHYWQRGMLPKAEEAYLIAQKCPHGGDASVQAEEDLRALPDMQDIPLPPPDANPLQPHLVPAVGEHPPTTP